MLNSDYRELCAVNLPYSGRQKYMHTFDLARPVMAQGYKDYLEPVMALCAAAGAKEGLAHMTVDEKVHYGWDVSTEAEAACRWLFYAVCWLLGPS